MKDYKKLKRRSYSLNFKFFFINVNDSINKEITLDIRGLGFDVFDIFIITNSLFFDDFYNIINTLNSKIKKEKDENDLMLEELDYIYSWHRANKILCYDVYMPWYLSKEDYCMYRQFKRKFERKYFCTIRERKFSNSIFPIKKAIGHLIVSNKKKMILKLFIEKLYLRVIILKKKKIYLKN